MSERYRHILSAVAAQPWALLPEKLAAICELIRFKAAGGDLTAAEVAAVTAGARQPAGVDRQGFVAVIPIVGTISQRGGMLSEASGGTSAERIGAMLAEALREPHVKAIALDVDSPGGSVGGIPELAASIRAARGQGKPIVAVANGLMASAAYWLASQADDVVASPSSDIGSIGVYGLHEDLSRALDQEGITVSLVSAGRYKTELSPYAPLADSARAYLQARVNDFYRLFVDDVAAGRRTTAGRVRSGFGEGRMLGAEASVRAGLADRVGTLQQVVGELAAGEVGYRRARLDAFMSRRPVAAGPPPEHDFWYRPVPTPRRTRAGQIELRRRRLALYEQ